ncbi:MAG: DMT family transporter [Rhodobacteraceae bacterium]|nr:DMT family transporter [Paracoccaceae bacterium]
MENFRGMVLITGSMLAFAIADALIKILSETLPTGEILMLMGIGGAAIFSAIALRRGDRIFTKAILNRSILLRAFGEVTGTVGMITALALIPYSTTAAITQAIPLVITMGAALFLGETVGWPRWSAIGVGFVGVLLIIRPGLDSFDPNSIFAVVAVLGLSMRDLATRTAPRLISTPVLSAYGFIVLVPTGLGLWLFTGGGEPPDLLRSAYLVGAIVLAVIGYAAITMAMRIGEVAAITPLRYTRIVFAMIIGVVIFGEQLDTMTLIGTAIVILSGLFTIYREHRARKRA